jgi:hypothetical protein
MKRYHITFTTSTLAGDLDEAISIAIDQIADGSAHMEWKKRRSKKKPTAPTSNPLRTGS